MSIERHVGGFVTYEDHVAEMEKLRQSVRRLVGEWRKDMEKLNELSARNESNILGPAAKGSEAAIVKCISELSALIDGKGEGDV